MFSSPLDFLRRDDGEGLPRWICWLASYTSTRRTRHFGAIRKLYFFLEG